MAHCYESCCGLSVAFIYIIIATKLFGAIDGSVGGIDCLFVTSLLSSRVDDDGCFCHDIFINEAK